MDAVHARLEGVTASFRHPLLISGTQASLPLPGYASLLGMLSACVGRVLQPNDVRVGFEYRFDSMDTDLQTTQRWTLSKGRLQPHRKGPGLLRRQFHIRPRLDLYATGPNLSELHVGLRCPVEAPRLGRSEDLAFVVFVRDVQLVPAQAGTLGPTLVRVGATTAAGLPLTLAEWFVPGRLGRARRPGAVGRFVGLPPQGDLRFAVHGTDLFHPSDAGSADEVVYLHNWGALA
jgi:CRISPR-associated protein Cas5t